MIGRHEYRMVRFVHGYDYGRVGRLVLVIGGGIVPG
jgi:hypothetical protein